MVWGDAKNPSLRAYTACCSCSTCAASCCVWTAGVATVSNHLITNSYSRSAWALLSMIGAVTESEAVKSSLQNAVGSLLLLSQGKIPREAQMPNNVRH